MVNRMRHTRAHTGNRRSHHALTAVGTTLCKECGHPKAKHIACSNCGKYKGREVIDVIKKAAKKSKKTATAAK